MHPTSNLCFFLLFLFLAGSLKAQEAIGLKRIEQYLTEEKLADADDELWKQINQFKAQGNLDTLASFPYLIGKVTLAIIDQETAVAKIEEFIGELKNKRASSRTLFNAYMNAVPFFDDAGLPQRSYELTLEALLHAEKMPDKTEREIGYVEYNLGASQLSIGDFDKAKSHFRKALAKYLNHPNMPPQKLSDAYNAMGAMMWLSSKLDSAKYFYGKAVSELDNLKDDPINKAYLSGIVQANIGLIHLSQDNTTESVRFIKKAIDNYQVTLNESHDESLKIKAQKYQWRSMANLATIYTEMGDFQTAHNLVTYVLRQHQKEFQPNDPEILHSKTKVAQSYLNLREYEEVIKIIDEVLAGYKKIPGDHIYWEATSRFTRAQAYDLLNKMPEAEAAYLKSEAQFEKSLKGEYDRDFLNFLTYKSSFFAKKGDALTAVKTAEKGYQLAEEIGGANSLMAFKHAVNLAEVYYRLGDNKKTMEWSEKSLAQLSYGDSQDLEFQDSIMIDLQKPRAILLSTKAEYQLQNVKDEPFLTGLLSRLEQVIPILERRKAINNSTENLNLLIAEHNDVFDFMKQLNYDLYNKTQKSQYLDDLLSLHESSLYTRIRTRLNTREAKFSRIPDDVLFEEKAIKDRMSKALSEESEHNHLERMEAYFAALDEWEKFLASIKQSYPEYYNLRFEAIVLPLDNVQSEIAEGSTVIRYLFVGEQLLALVIDRNNRELFQLEYTPVSNYISQLADNQLEISGSGPLIQALYQQIWAPFANKITTEKVVIIPDGDLFNLSFELLTPELLTDHRQFAQKSLLANHAISYNYSLLLLNRKKKTRSFSGNYIAFAPGFFDDMKTSYRTTRVDSLNFDEQYLSLLPQPFTSDLAQSMKQFFKGEAYLQEQSTEASFKKNANLHKIIHIGTHAESNNLSPELSRLVFAKAPLNPDPEEDNYLYAYEVYNCDLASNLTLLTACETGKPGYQPGEGMISMAHAFNYAGSESILTGLWKIDEKSSTEIINLFYHNLAKGMDKDIALKKAKLTYIENAPGRTSAPEYWAGLILLGDTSPIELSKPTNPLYWILGVSLLILAFLGFQRKWTS